MNINDVFDKIDNDTVPSLAEIEFLLRSEGDEMALLYDKADSARRKYMGDDVYLRGIVEFSNFCVKNCFYCGIQASNGKIERYRMSDNEILEVAKDIEKMGQTTIVLQSGEDPFYTKEKIVEITRAIKRNTSLAVTLSVGERDRETYRAWKDAGMDRYLLRFETSDKKLFKMCHKNTELDERLKCLGISSLLG
jgi:biotin synthase